MKTQSVSKQEAIDVLEDALTTVNDPHAKGVAVGLCWAFYMAGLLTKAERDTYIDQKINQALESIAQKQIQYEEYFVNDKVGLLVKHLDLGMSEYFLFSNFDDMRDCALAHHHIPRSLWEKLCTMMVETTTFHEWLNHIIYGKFNHPTRNCG